LPFNLKVEELTIPSVCPVLGLPLKTNYEVVKHDSPSIDRIDPKGGYTMDNVRIISHRANTLKNDASIEELEKVLQYMKSFQKTA
jgi:hypothetical protein